MELDGASEQLQDCQESLRECQAGAARSSAAGALAEAKLQQALAAAEANFRASTQASKALYLSCSLSDMCTWMGNGAAWDTTMLLA